MNHAHTDRLTRFLIQEGGVRGVHVRLDEAWAQVRTRAPYPDAVARLLGEAVAASALFTGHAKVDGRLAVQLRGSGALRTLFAECTAAGTVRGIAALAEGAGEVTEPLQALGGDGLLAITIENPGLRGQEPARYQGLVSLGQPTLAEAFEDYFRQSEQLPTRLLLAADDGRVAGLMLQKLPGDEGDADGWERASALFDTLGGAELLDTPADRLLHRLFHEDGVQVLGDKELRFGCTCSRERVAGMLESLGEAEAREAAAGHGGEVEVHCEFCGQRYVFDGADLDALFAPGPASVPAPERLQ